jgi:hypothetical protein
VLRTLLILLIMTMTVTPTRVMVVVMSFFQIPRRIMVVCAIISTATMAEAIVEFVFRCDFTMLVMVTIFLTLR